MTTIAIEDNARKNRSRTLCASHCSPVQLACIEDNRASAIRQSTLANDFHHTAASRQTRALQSRMTGSAGPVFQRKKLEDDEPVQAKKSDDMRQRVRLRTTGSGLPDNLQAGIQGLSGLDVSGIRVRYNSPEPAQVNALAFTRGNEIHLGAGQEKHLPHEAWHAVQQRQDRVRPTRRLSSGIPVNDSPALEKEADIMGARALQFKLPTQLPDDGTPGSQRPAPHRSPVQTIQRQEAAGPSAGELLAMSARVSGSHQADMGLLIRMLLAVDTPFVHDTYTRNFGKATPGGIRDPDAIYSFYRSMWLAGMWRHERTLMAWWAKISSVPDPEAFVKGVFGPEFDPGTRAYMRILLTGTKSWDFCRTMVLKVWQRVKAGTGISAEAIYRPRDIYKAARPPADIKKVTCLNDAIRLLDYWGVGLLAVVDISKDYFLALLQYASKLKRNSSDPAEQERLGRQYSDFAAHRQRLIMRKSRYHELLGKLNTVRGSAEKSRDELAGLARTAGSPKDVMETTGRQVTVLNACQASMAGLENSVLSSIRQIPHRERATANMRKYVRQADAGGSFLSMASKLVTAGFGTFAIAITGKKDWIGRLAAGLKVGGFAGLAAKGARLVFRKLLAGLGVDEKQVMKLINNAGPLLMTIIKQTPTFFKNLFKAVKKGFRQFVANIKTHIKTALVGILFGKLAADLGVTMPKDLSLKSIVIMLLQVLGLTPEAFRKRLAGCVGEARLARLEKAWDFINKFFGGGISGLATAFSGYLGNLKSFFITAVTTWLINKVVMAGVDFVVKLLSPIPGLGPLITAFSAFVKLVLEKGRQIAMLGSAVYGSVVPIAQGKLAPAANRIENALGLGVALAAGLLANLAKVGDIGTWVRQKLEALGTRIDTGLKTLCRKCKEKLERLFGRGKGTGKGTGKAKGTKPFSFPRFYFSARKKKSYVTAERRKGRPRLVVVSSPGVPVSTYLFRAVNEGLIEQIQNESHQQKARDLRKKVVALSKQDQEMTMDIVYSGKNQPVLNKKQERLARQISNHFQEIWDLVGVSGGLHKDELKVDSYNSLNSIKGPLMSPHHVPQDGLMKRMAKWVQSVVEHRMRGKDKITTTEKFKKLLNYDRNQGICILMDRNRHRETRTFGMLHDDLENPSAGIVATKDVLTPKEVWARVKRVRIDLKADIKDVRQIYEGKKYTPALTHRSDKGRLTLGLKELRRMNRASWHI